MPVPGWIMQGFPIGADWQKGKVDGTYTCDGLIERAAEEVGINGGEGFIPNWIETPKSAGILPLMGFSQLTPWLLYDAASRQQEYFSAEDALIGTIDSADFILTDPLGRRLGHTAVLGQLNEIPGAFYSGDGDLEQFSILDPLLGQYKLELFGLGEDVTAAMTTRYGDVEYEGHLESGDGYTLSLSLDSSTVPEPSTLLIWSALLGIVVTIGRRRRSPGRSVRVGSTD